MIFAAQSKAGVCVSDVAGLKGIRSSRDPVRFYKANAFTEATL